MNAVLHAKSGCTIPLEDHPPGSHYEDETSFIEFMQHIMHLKAEHVAHQANRTEKRVATNESSRANKSNSATMKPIYIQGAMIATQCGFHPSTR